MKLVILSQMLNTFYDTILFTYIIFEGLCEGISSVVRNETLALSL